MVCNKWSRVSFQLSIGYGNPPHHPINFHLIALETLTLKPNEIPDQTRSPSNRMRSRATYYSVVLCRWMCTLVGVYTKRSWNSFGIFSYYNAWLAFSASSSSPGSYVALYALHTLISPHFTWFHALSLFLSTIQHSAKTFPLRILEHASSLNSYYCRLWVGFLEIWDVRITPHIWI